MRHNIKDGRTKESRRGGRVEEKGTETVEEKEEEGEDL